MFGQLFLARLAEEYFSRLLMGGKVWLDLQITLVCHPIDFLQLQQRVVASQTFSVGHDAPSKSWPDTWHAGQSCGVCRIQFQNAAYG